MAKFSCFLGFSAELRCRNVGLVCSSLCVIKCPFSFCVTKEFVFPCKLLQLRRRNGLPSFCIRQHTRRCRGVQSFANSLNLRVLVTDTFSYCCDDAVSIREGGRRSQALAYQSMGETSQIFCTSYLIAGRGRTSP